MRTYYRYFFCVLLASLSLVYLLNVLVDPLWFGKGNQLGQRNTRYDERWAKWNLFSQNPKSYDCLIFGSSTSSVFRPSQFPDAKCFNYAISYGFFGEFQLISQAIVSHHGVKPKTIYIATDWLNIVKRPADTYRTSFLKLLKTPTPRWKAYLTFNITKFSLFSLFSKNRSIRHYDRDFHAQFDFPFPKHQKDKRYYYDPDPNAAPASPHCPEHRLSAIKKMRAQFPSTKFVGYVPPRSAAHTFRSYQLGNHKRFLSCVKEYASLFDEYYDFSAISQVTENSDLSFDGTHYHPAVFARMAKVLNGQPSQKFGSRITPDNFNAFQKKYTESFKDGFYVKFREISDYQDPAKLAYSGAKLSSKKAGR